MILVTSMKQYFPFEHSSVPRVGECNTSHMSRFTAELVVLIWRMLTLLHSERLKLFGVLTVLSAVGLN